MWKSYHIYRVEYNDFLSKVEYLTQKFIIGKNALFFTLYTDMKGPHCRLRIREDSTRIGAQIFRELETAFPGKSIEERIYDPEIIKYGLNLKAYEHFSIDISDFIIKHRKEFIHKDVTANCVLGLMKSMLVEFNLYDVQQIEGSINFWGRNKNYFQASINRQAYQHLFPEDHFSTYLRDFVGKLCISTTNEARELCFNLIHLAVNRFNFNLKDECLLYYKLYEQGV